jgi:succinate-semialdehyde dehydrogenase/glutarate-semialdehyde dehydrogenase
VSRIEEITESQLVRIGALRTDLYIGGRWRPAASGKRIDVFDPSTEGVIASVADASPAEAIEAVDAAADALQGWAGTPPRHRAEVLRKAVDLMSTRVDWFAELISIENGKTLADARGEVQYAAEFLRWFAEEAVRINGELSIAPSGTNRILVQYQPVGVAVLVTPWNFPAAMATRKLGPALAAGCTCVLKPAKETPLTAYAIAELLHEAGVPPGAVNVLTTSSSGSVVSTMLHDARVRKLSFTGSTEVGRRLLHEAADTVVNCSMELGGNAPFIVLDDADLEQALDGAMVAKMRNGGEACTSANRFYVQRGIFERFASGLADRMQRLELGKGLLPSTQCGPLINASSVQRLSDLVTDAVRRGARVLVGGPVPDRVGFFYPPTVLVDVPHDAPIVREEIFGPVAVVMPFDTSSEAIERANETEYGLVAYVYTADLSTGLGIAERLESGMVAINRGLVSDPAAPFGGVKQSGLGREGGHQGLLEFMEAKYIATSW